MEADANSQIVTENARQTSNLLLFGAAKVFAAPQFARRNDDEKDARHVARRAEVIALSRIANGAIQIIAFVEIAD